MHGKRSLGRQCVYVATLIFALDTYYFLFLGNCKICKIYAYQQKIEMGILRDL